MYCRLVLFGILSCSGNKHKSKSTPNPRAERPRSWSDIFPCDASFGSWLRRSPTQFSHTRMGLVLFEVATTTFCGKRCLEHVSQTTSPHLRQWCRRFTMVNPDLQTKHSFSMRSCFHTAAVSIASSLSVRPSAAMQPSTALNHWSRVSSSGAVTTKLFSARISNELESPFAATCMLCKSRVRWCLTLPRLVSEPYIMTSLKSTNAYLMFDLRDTLWRFPCILMRRPVLVRVIPHLSSRSCSMNFCCDISISVNTYSLVSPITACTFDRSLKSSLSCSSSADNISFETESNRASRWVEISHRVVCMRNMASRARGPSWSRKCTPLSSICRTREWYSASAARVQSDLKSHSRWRALRVSRSSLALSRKSEKAFTSFASPILFITTSYFPNACPYTRNKEPLRSSTSFTFTSVAKEAESAAAPPSPLPSFAAAAAAASSASASAFPSASSAFTSPSCAFPSPPSSSPGAAEDSPSLALSKPPQAFLRSARKLVSRIRMSLRAVKKMVWAGDSLRIVGLVDLESCNNVSTNAPFRMLMRAT
mmetsp:Transcript_93155/g.266155  ORF Transcript_93155/g.266155 Transcript_93155/m.266155 type:complete len:537 (-) Transcript_93155:736-2346(-)